jgi:hypothetical protein
VRIASSLSALLVLALPASLAAQNSPSNFFDTSSVGTLSVKSGDTPQALSIESTAVKVEIVGRMARTEVTQVFRSHLSRQSEGEYRFTLPDGASVSRLAMDVEGKMMEGELHERKRARQIYEGIVAKMKDPALLEWEGGNRFKTRIFPIPPRGTKTVILTYEQLLDGASPHYSYALPKLVGVDHDVAFGSFEFSLTAWETGKLELATYGDAKTSSDNGVERVSLRKRDFVPDGPVIVSLPRIQGAAKLMTAKVDGERFFLLDHTPKLPPATLSMRPLVFAVDTSASVGDTQLSRVRAVIAELAAAHPAPHVVVYGDLDTVTCSDNDGGACLRYVKAGGGSDLAKLLQEAAGRARAFGKPATILLLSDGTPTLGPLDGQVIATRASRGAGPDITIHTVGVGLENDFGLLDAVASASGGRREHLLPTRDLSEATISLAMMLRTPVLRDVRVRVSSGRVEGLVPHLARNLAPGEPIAVLGRIEEGPVTLEFEGVYAGQPIHQTLTVAPRGRSHEVVRNFWARGVLETMEKVGAPPERIVRTSLHYGVMSRYTSFLVLENEAAYARHGVERRKVKRSEKSLANLVTGGQRNAGKGCGGEEGFMGDLDQNTLSGTVPGNVEGLLGGNVGSGSGGLGLRGSGRGGGGSGFGRIQGLGRVDTGGGKGVRGRLSGRKVRRVPMVIPGRAVVMGSLDKSLIQRVIRRRINAVRYCYERELQRDPNLAGKVTVQWTIADNGRVQSAAVKSSTLGSARAETCIVHQIRRLRFPTVQGGGIVRIVYPFVFTGGPSQSFAGLEKSRDSLEPYRRSQLIGWWLDQGKRKRALTYLRSSQKQFTAPLERIELFQVLAVRQAFPQTFEAAALRAIKTPTPPSWVAAGLAAAVAPRGAAAVLEVFGPCDKLGAESASSVLMVLIDGVHDRAGNALAMHWARTWPAETMVQVLASHAASLPEPTLLVTTKVLDARYDERALRNHYAAASATDPTRAAAQVAAHCGTPPKGMLAECRRMLDTVGHGPDVERAREQLLGAVEKDLRQQRAGDFDNADLIAEIARVLRERKRPDQAARVLSELVEFSGSTPARRQRYMSELAAAGDTSGACRELGTVAQLDPNQREVFRSMMAMRRTGTLSGKEADACIVAGVASLPASASVTAVLTWDDATADVDLRILEPGGETVSYSMTQSKAGGLLYYDVRDGFGPEIYASPARAAGKYDFRVVYYGGAAKDVKARLTLIENPGTANERRLIKDVVLPAATHAVDVSISVPE